MEFFDRNLTPTQLRRGVLIAAIALTISLPLYSVTVIWHHARLRPGWFAASVGLFACIGALSFGQFLSVRRRGRLVGGAGAVFLLACVSAVSLGVVAASVPAIAAEVLMVIVVVAVFVAIIGDRPMQVAGWLVEVATVAGAAWEAGIRGSAYAVTLILTGSTFAIAQAMVRIVVSDLNAGAHAQSARRALIDAASAMDTIEDALAACLPLVPAVLPSSRIVAIVARPGRSCAVLASWPDPSPADAELATLTAFARALEGSEPTVTAWHVFVPVGFVEEGELMLVAERARANTAEYAVREAAEAIASTFLRLTGRLGNLQLLREQSRTDPLTGLANRRTLWERLDVEIARARRNRSPFTVAIIDLDHFKEFNDELGHLAGDAMLKAMAGMMVGRLRAQDLLARYGGEEFCALLPDTEATGARNAMEQLRAGALDVPGPLPVTLCAGVAEWDGAEDAIQLLARADQALYRAKHEGRDRVVVANGSAARGRA